MIGLDFKYFKIDDSVLKKNMGFILCNQCTDKRSVKKNRTLFVDKNQGAWSCLHCGYSGNLEHGVSNKTDYRYKDKKWLLNAYLGSYENLKEYHENKALNEVMEKHYGLKEETVNAFKLISHISYNDKKENFANGVGIPYFQGGNLVNIVTVAPNGYRNEEKNGLEVCFNIDRIDNEEVVIVLDEVDVMTMYECGKRSVVSLFMSNLNIEKGDFSHLNYLINVEKIFDQVKKFIIVVPPMGEYLNYQEEVIHRLGKERCWTAETSSPLNSVNDDYKAYGVDGVNGIISNAKPVPITGIYTIDDVEKEFDRLYEEGLEEGVSTGIPGLDEFYKVTPGQLTTVTGIPGHGKSNVLDQIFVNLAKNNGWSFGLFSPENQPIHRHFANMAEKYAEATFDKGGSVRMGYELKEESKVFLRKYFHIILPEEDELGTLENVLLKAKTLVYRVGIRGLLLDPWNEIEHERRANQSETEYTSWALTKIKSFARRMNVHVWLVAHPTKLHKDRDTGLYPVPTPYDISGSAHFRNKTDNAFTVYRFVGYKDESVTDIHVQKIRFKENGRVGVYSVRYDKNRSVYRDDIDQSKRIAALEKGQHLHPHELVIDGF